MNPSPDMKDLEFRARELKRLGNSDADIRAVLTRAGASEEQIDAIMPRPQKKSSGVGFCLVFAFALAVLVLGAGVFLLVTLKPAAPSTDPRSSDSAGIALPLPEFNILPTDEDFSRTPVPKAVLPANAEQYFSVIWNLEGTSMEKSAQLAGAMPPVELMVAHAEMAMSYAVFARTDQDLKTMEVMIEMECAGVTNTYCRDRNLEKIKFEIDREKAFSDMTERWLRTCETWRDYYERAGVPFPYGDSRCKYP